MNDRRHLILNTIIKEHIESSVPVGSSVLVDKYKLGISPATARNEMSWLEKEGYIIQPHISAGRVPTEKAYLFFLENLDIKKFKGRYLDDITTALKDDSDLSFKETAKIMSQLTGSAVFWAFHKNNLFYTGISNLFSQPEFSQINIIQDVSNVIDKMEEIIDSIFDEIKFGVSTQIGQENPFGVFCSTIFLKYRTSKGVGVCGILGPMRMDYEKNIAIAQYIENNIKKIVS